MKKVRYRIILEDNLGKNYYAGKDYNNTYEQEFRQNGWHTYQDIRHDKILVDKNKEKAILLTSRELKTLTETLDRLIKYELVNILSYKIEIVEI